MMHTKIKLLESYEKELVSGGAKKKGPIVTVSGLSGSGKSSVVEMLMKAMPQMKLVYSGGIFREMAKKAGMSVEEFSARRDEEDDVFLDKETLKRSIEGNAVVDCRIGAWSIGGWADFRIFVTCPLGTRIDRVAKREKLSSASARNKVESRDASDSRRYRELYGIDVNDLGVYDIIIDNGGTMDELRKGVKKVAEEILGSFLHIPFN